MLQSTVKRRQRTIYSSHQLQVLEETFLKCAGYLETDKRQDLAHELAITEERIAIWFQNRRARLKRGQKLPWLCLSTNYDAYLTDRTNAFPLTKTPDNRTLSSNLHKIPTGECKEPFTDGNVSANIPEGRLDKAKRKAPDVSTPTNGKEKVECQTKQVWIDGNVKSSTSSKPKQVLIGGDATTGKPKQVRIGGDVIASTTGKPKQVRIGGDVIASTTGKPKQVRIGVDVIASTSVKPKQVRIGGDVKRCTSGEPKPVLIGGDVIASTIGKPKQVRIGDDVIGTASVKPKQVRIGGDVQSSTNVKPKQIRIGGDVQSSTSGEPKPVRIDWGVKSSTNGKHKQVQIDSGVKSSTTGKHNLQRRRKTSKRHSIETVTTLAGAEKAEGEPRLERKAKRRRTSVPTNINKENQTMKFVWERSHENIFSSESIFRSLSLPYILPRYTEHTRSQANEHDPYPLGNYAEPGSDASPTQTFTSRMSNPAELMSKPTSNKALPMSTTSFNQALSMPATSFNQALYMSATSFNQSPLMLHTTCNQAPLMSITPFNQAMLTSGQAPSMPIVSSKLQHKSSMPIKCSDQEQMTCDMPTKSSPTGSELGTLKLPVTLPRSTDDRDPKPEQLGTLKLPVSPPNPADDRDPEPEQFETLKLPVAPSSPSDDGDPRPEQYGTLTLPVSSSRPADDTPDSCSPDDDQCHLVISQVCSLQGLWWQEPCEGDLSSDPLVKNGTVLTEVNHMSDPFHPASSLTKVYGSKDVDQVDQGSDIETNSDINFTNCTNLPDDVVIMYMSYSDYKRTDDCATEATDSTEEATSSITEASSSITEASSSITEAYSSATETTERESDSVSDCEIIAEEKCVRLPVWQKWA